MTYSGRLMVERVHVIHVEDVIKSQEDHVPGVFSDKAQAIYLWHLCVENRVWLAAIALFLLVLTHHTIRT